MSPGLAARLGERSHLGGVGFIPFVIIGYPDLRVSLRALEFLAARGAAAFETAVPVKQGWSSDTNAIIQNALRVAAGNGVDVRIVTREARAFRPNVVVVYRPVVKEFGWNSLLARFAGVVDAVLLEWGAASVTRVHTASSRGVESVQFVSSLMSKREIARRVRLTTAFVYLTSAARTGGRRFSRARIEKAIAMVRMTRSDVRVCCAFGIQTASDIRELATIPGCDAVIVGTALLRALGRGWLHFKELAESLTGAARRG